MAGIRCTGCLISPRTAIIELAFGGFFIFPITQLLLRISGRRSSLSRENPLGHLAMQIAFTVPIGMLLLVPITQLNLNLFYPALLVIVGAHYLPFIFLYGMRIFGALAVILVGGGVVIAMYFPRPSAWPDGLAVSRFLFSPGLDAAWSRVNFGPTNWQIGSDLYQLCNHARHFAHRTVLSWYASVGRLDSMRQWFALVALALYPFAFEAQTAIQPDPPHRDWNASWITHPSAPLRDPVVLHFRRALTLRGVPASYLVRVSADNRFILYVNGNR